MKRWTAHVYYKNGAYPSDRYDFDEYDELGELVERGPDWAHINRIIIHYNLAYNDNAQLCNECGAYPRDIGAVCAGCYAYRDHTGAA